jgi:hypothetical protein
VDIRSTPSGLTPQAQSGRARGATPAAAPRPGAPPATPADAASVDRVELSPAARELNARLESGAAEGGLSPERLRQITGRMQGGYYDQAGVIDRVLKGVLSELARGDSQE